MKIDVFICLHFDYLCENWLLASVTQQVHSILSNRCLRIQNEVSCPELKRRKQFVWQVSTQLLVPYDFTVGVLALYDWTWQLLSCCRTKCRNGCDYQRLLGSDHCRSWPYLRRSLTCESFLCVFILQTAVTVVQPFVVQVSELTLSTWSLCHTWDLFTTWVVYWQDWLVLHWKRWAAGLFTEVLSEQWGVSGHYQGCWDVTVSGELWTWP